MSYDEIGVRLGEVLMRYGLDQLARRQDEKLYQQRRAEERADSMVAAANQPPAQRKRIVMNDDGTYEQVGEEYRGGAWQESYREPVMMDESKAKRVRIVLSDGTPAMHPEDEPLPKGARFYERPQRQSGGTGGSAREPDPPKRTLVEDRKTHQQRWVLEGDPIGPNEFAVRPKAYPDRAAGRGKRDEPGFLDRLADAGARFADAAQRQASATEKAEKPVQVRTDKHGRKWNIYADGTMELAEP